MARPKGYRLSDESRKAIGDGQKAYRDEIQERLELADRLIRAAEETPDLPVSEVVGLMLLDNNKEQ